MQSQLNWNLEINSQYSENVNNLQKDDNLKNVVNLKWRQPENKLYKMNTT